jgi:DNA-binding NarL/FixJ family response regulator
LASLLANSVGLNVIGQTAGGETLTADLDLYRPEIVVYDLGWNPTPAIAGFTSLRGLPVLALLPDEEHAADAVTALRANTTPYGLLLREAHPDRLTTALNALSRGLLVIDPALADAVLSAGDSVMMNGESPVEDLTPREKEVLQLLTQGLANKTIAAQLSISEHTVKFHVNAIMTKLGAQSRTDAVVRATRLGLVIL